MYDSSLVAKNQSKPACMQYQTLINKEDRVSENMLSVDLKNKSKSVIVGNNLCCLAYNAQIIKQLSDLPPKVTSHDDMLRCFQSCKLKIIHFIIECNCLNMESEVHSFFSIISCLLMTPEKYFLFGQIERGDDNCKRLIIHIYIIYTFVHSSTFCTIYLTSSLKCSLKVY